MEEGRQVEEQIRRGRERERNLKGKKRMGKVMKVESRYWSSQLLPVIRQGVSME